MVALRSRRLESLFGVPLDALRADDVRGLVTSGVQEAFDLDFKSTTYGHGGSEKRDLAGDVAALANTAGGVIILGVEEDDQARATAAPGVEITDQERRRILQVVASNVAPMPVLDVIFVVDDAAGPPPRGFIVIAVPRSPGAPHAVLINDALRYPKRNGATTRYLSEPEVAAAYRDRLSGAARQDQRVRDVESEGIQRLDVADARWLVVSLVPDLPGDLVISWETYKAFERDVLTSPSAVVRNNVHFQRAKVGRRRLLADGGMDGPPLAKRVDLEVHSDGAGLYGREIPVRKKSPFVYLAHDEAMVVTILSGLQLLAKHSEDLTAASGNVIVRAQWVPSSPVELVGIANFREDFDDTFGGPVTANTLSPVESVAALDDIAQPGTTLVSVAASLANDMWQAFGIPEMRQLSRDGALRRPYWRAGWRQEIVSWAERHGIPVTDD